MKKNRRFVERHPHIATAACIYTGLSVVGTAISAASGIYFIKKMRATVTELKEEVAATAAKEALEEALIEEEAAIAAAEVES